jgi:neopullulanase
MKKNQPLLAVFFAIFVSSISVSAQNYTIKHVDPPFWYVGMKNQNLQIMIHGENVGDLEPQLSYTGIEIDRIVRVPNPNYLFIYLRINAEAKAGSFLISCQKGGVTLLSYLFKVNNRIHGSSERKGFDNSDAIYLITPDRFSNGDPTNDNMPGMTEQSNRSQKDGRHGGDIRGIIKNLDYIKDMGFTALWLNPVLENNQKTVSYHGYSITDFYKVDPRFGTVDDYLELSNLSGEKGIKLIMDMVMNHCGSEHWWVMDPPTPDWFHYDGAFVSTNHRRSTLNDPYASAVDREVFEKGWFVPTMPDMNQENLLLADYLIQNSIWWIEFANLAGIRHDTHPYAGKDFMSKWTCRIMYEYPMFNIVGEEWTENPAIIAKWQKGKVNPDGYTSCLPSLMDFPMQMALSRALTEPESWNTGLIVLYEMLSNDFQYQDPYNLVVFPDNHDIDRFFVQMKKDPQLFRLGMTYFLTIRGIPQFLYGTEILLVNEIQGDHGLIRADFPGGWPHDQVSGFLDIGLDQQQIDARNFLKRLLNWRKDNPVLHSGKLMHYSPDNGLYAYFRYNETKKVMILLNKSNNELVINPESYPEMLNGKVTGTDIVTGKEDLLGHWRIPARSPLILEIN